ncbi:MULTISPECIES: SRPBCC family protein [unclassified Pedobacter]|uniref:SRPBCC family protein n=1 Tax=unclassified Pedobacter TaxID=2628915 RepID=UPI00141E8055|nr:MULTISPECIES: SRPBCC family protein [unclassified Pedobacter]NII84072.1 ligand-binding SRPBCC domain-containing protein [Pedobacter sp. SG908]NMN39012.1 ligand-binding SRPBCC domain-containing protein [Pedobacter sp. SG918]
MPIIILKTLINAPIEHCFDLSRNIDLHLQSMKASGENAIAGKKTGLINLHESVTWRARHFGIPFEMTNKISKMEYPTFFVDEMIKGPFKKLHHQHQFKIMGSQTEMTDIFEFQAPFGLLGWLVEKIFLKNYMLKLIEKRNKVIKLQAER